MLELARRTWLAALALLPAAAVAQPPSAWPARPMRLIIPFPPGGSTDLLARLLADRLAHHLRQNVVAENRAGAAGSIAAELATRAEPDGHTLFFGTVGTASINMHIYPRLPYRPEDLAPVALWADLPNVIVVAHHSPIRSLAGLIEAARARPGELSYASAGSGTTLHLSGELLKAMAGVDLLHVPFRGGNDSMNQVLGGRVDLAFNNLPTAIGLIRSGELRALAVTGAERSPALPEVPTVAELLPGYEATSWFGLQVPAGTPAPIVARLNAVVNAALAEPATVERITMAGARPRGGTPEEYAAFIRAETAKWAEVVRRSGARLD
ncbi:Bug family tripartite tricarboxylate transporter substrate binding protein [Crenalkalicoccus roseus]|uniref:Bug family tripartite tricarboxylate transporter substrate binding protein n=1 Tax=Crenalkalicoccus roseus TaxID=1485588 RepID=UPI00107FF43C|nr:tripartite tricarboxylate transporter substrate binding protein [Crenalkalicoccus roseus]